MNREMFRVVTQAMNAGLWDKVGTILGNLKEDGITDKKTLHLILQAYRATVTCPHLCVHIQS